MKKLNQDSYYGSEYSAESIEEQNKRYAEDFLLNLLGLIHAEFSSSENQDELSIDKHFGMPMLNFNEDGICLIKFSSSFANIIFVICLKSSLVSNGEFFTSTISELELL